MSKQTADVLKRAKERLETRGWVQGNFETARGCCAVGAIIAETLHNNDAFYAAENALDEALGMYAVLITEWNDDPSRTKEEVLSLFDKAIENELKN